MVGTGSALFVCTEHLSDTDSYDMNLEFKSVRCEFTISVGQTRLLCLCPSAGVVVGSMCTHSMSVVDTGSALSVCTEHLSVTDHVT